MYGLHTIVVRQPCTPRFLVCTVCLIPPTSPPTLVLPPLTLNSVSRHTTGHFKPTANYWCIFSKCASLVDSPHHRTRPLLLVQSFTRSLQSFLGLFPRSLLPIRQALIRYERILSRRHMETLTHTAQAHTPCILQRLCLLPEPWFHPWLHLCRLMFHHRPELPVP